MTNPAENDTNDDNSINMLNQLVAALRKIGLSYIEMLAAKQSSGLSTPKFFTFDIPSLSNIRVAKALANLSLNPEQPELLQEVAILKLLNQILVSNVDPKFLKLIEGIVCSYQPFLNLGYPLLDSEIRQFIGPLVVNALNEYRDGLIHDRLSQLNWPNKAEELFALVMMEFYRLNIPNQPKGCLIEYENEIRSITKSKEDLKSIAETTPEEFKQNIKDGNYTGYFKLKILGRLFGRESPSIDKLAVTNDGQLIQDITPEPNLKEKSITVHTIDAFYKNADKYGGQDSAALKAEINKTLMGLLILPDSLISKFPAAYTADPQEQGVVFRRKFMAGLEQLWEAANGHPIFQEYMSSDAARDDFKSQVEMLKTFRPLGKPGLVTEDMEVDMRDLFEDIQSIVAEQQDLIKSGFKLSDLKSVAKEESKLPSFKRDISFLGQNESKKEEVKKEAAKPIVLPPIHKKRA